jgi:hypothetical protein
MDLHGHLRDNLIFWYVDDVPISEETHVWASTASYNDSFTLLYVDDVRTSQEAHASTVCYGEERSVVVRDTTGGGNRIYHRF